MNNKSDHMEYSNLRKSVKDRFPRIVILIVLAEFCERFSYSGMRAFLTLYLRSKLNYSDDGATEIYHIFSTFVYVFPIFGGILADNYLGKFRTILYMMFVYAFGNILVAVTAIPQLALPGRLCTMIGLFMITMGTGGIKPCVTAFGGDQFMLPQQEKHLAVYFSVLYFTLCTGSLIAKTVSPILRAEVHCFGDKDCYSLAFGAPGLIVIIAIVIFVSAKSKYVMKKPEGNVVFDFVKCVSLGLKNAVMTRRKYEKNSHWLDSAEHRYDQKFIKDIKKTLSILMLFTVLPVFWSLLDQLGSRWTLQATKMDGRFWFVTVKPDQMQVIGPIFILIIIPLFQRYLYPFLERRNILKNPLHKLTLGGFLAGISFIASGSLELYLKTTYPQLPQPGYSQLRIFNGHPCAINIQSNVENITYVIPSLSHFSKKDFEVASSRNVSLKLGGDCMEDTEQVFLLEENSAISYFLQVNQTVFYRDNVDKSRTGFPVVRFLVSSELNNRTINLYNNKRHEVEMVINSGVSELNPVFASTYSIRVDNVPIENDLEIESGGVYAVVMNKRSDESVNSNMIVVTKANSISMALLLPQFLIISIAEVLFAVTGNEFAFKESPESMKAVMTAAWLLTESVGNVLIILVTRLFVNYEQSTQFFMYTGMMFVSITIFHFMAKGYQFRCDDEDESVEPPCKKKTRSNSEVLYLQVKQAEDYLDH